MVNDLHNQPLKTSIDDADHIAIGIPGQVGCNNITGENLLKQTANWNILSETFDNGDLSANKLEINHGKNTLIIRATLYDPDGIVQPIGGVFKVVDANNVEFDFGGSIQAGNWRYIIEYILI